MPNTACCPGFYLATLAIYCNLRSRNYCALDKNEIYFLLILDIFFFYCENKVSLSFPILKNATEV